jgi:hypothetical protein
MLVQRLKFPHREDKLESLSRNIYETHDPQYNTFSVLKLQKAISTSEGSKDELTSKQ